jgi:hypothetical protein
VLSKMVRARFPAELVSAAEERAELEERTFSSILRRAVTAYVADEPNDDQATDRKVTAA